MGCLYTQLSLQMWMYWWLRSPKSPSNASTYVKGKADWWSVKKACHIVLLISTQSDLNGRQRWSVLGGKAPKTPSSAPVVCSSCSLNSQAAMTVDREDKNLVNVQTKCDSITLCHIMKKYLKLPQRFPFTCKHDALLGDCLPWLRSRVVQRYGDVLHSCGSGPSTLSKLLAGRALQRCLLHPLWTSSVLRFAGR